MSNDINFEYVEDFVDYIVDEIENDEGVFITIIAKFDEAKEIIKSIMLYDVDFESLQIESPMADGYHDEFVISVWGNDYVLQVGCEKLKNENGQYTNPCGDVVYLYSNCSSKIIPLCDGAELYFVDVEDECDCECDECCTCDCYREDGVYVERSIGLDGKTHGFTGTKSNENEYCSFSYYTDNILSDEEIAKMLKEFGF